jgi:hypothetical protein
VRRAAPWLALGALVVIAAVLLASQPSSNDSPYHSSTSDGPNGTSALRLYASALGHRVGSLDNGFDIPDDAALLFVFTPAIRFTTADAGALRAWVSRGGVVVYADEDLDPRLRGPLGIGRGTAYVSAEERAVVPALDGALELDAPGVVLPVTAGPGQAVLFRSTTVPNGALQPLIVESRLGQGRVIDVADPRLLANKWITDADNWRLAADLIALGHSGQILFDEYHHNPLAQPGDPNDWVRQPWGVALLWAVFALLAGFAVRGRAFGPRLPPPGATPPDRSSAEYAEAVGRLLRRSGGRAATAAMLWDAVRRALAARLGVGQDTPFDRLPEVVGRRAPGLADEYAQAEREVQEAPNSEEALLRTARRLQALAYPIRNTARPGS